ncbi:MAG: hypothetical protein PUH24_02185 [Prevotellaceae bacterium]|nr:hypothetical protein [Prevotellaceae bacterium]MDY6130454.1 hypothetical protein [Prevotella sp.]
MMLPLHILEVMDAMNACHRVNTDRPTEESKKAMVKSFIGLQQ